VVGGPNPPPSSPVIWLLLGLLALGGSAYAGIDSVRAFDWEPVAGEVIEDAYAGYVQGSSGRHGREVWHTQVRYVDKRGERWTFNTGTDLERSMGDEVPLLVDPTGAHLPIVDTFDERWKTPLYALLAALFCMVVAGRGALRNRRSSD
jgi:hypothetical protein